MIVPEAGVIQMHSFLLSAEGSHRTGVSVSSFTPNIRSESAVSGAEKRPFNPKFEPWASQIGHGKRHSAV